MQIPRQRCYGQYCPLLDIGFGDGHAWPAVSIVCDILALGCGEQTLGSWKQVDEAEPRKLLEAEGFDEASGDICIIRLVVAPVAPDGSD